MLRPGLAILLLWTLWGLSWLAAQLGEAAYADYRWRAPMLIPFGPKGR